MTIQELREKRCKAVADGRAIRDRIEAEGRELTTEEEARWDRFMTEAEDLATQIAKQERQERQEAELNQYADIPVDGDSRDASTDNEGGDELEERAFFNSLRYDRHEMDVAERRALQVDQSTKGGIFVPKTVVNKLLKNVDDLMPFRGMATVIQTGNAESIGAPRLTSDPDDADWTTELGTGSEDDAMAFGLRELKPSPIAKRIKISNTLLRKVPGIEALVRERLAYKLATPQESAFMTGTGVNAPLGIFTAADTGISTGRDVSTGNTATSITFDNLKTVMGTLKAQYWSKAAWLFHRDGRTQITKLKDGEGQYLWSPDNRQGDGETLLGKRLIVSEYAPNTFTTGQYVGMFADFSHYWIAESLAMSISRLDELYAETNQTGFILRAELDGMPTIEEAFVRIKLGS